MFFSVLVHANVYEGWMIGCMPLSPSLMFACETLGHRFSVFCVGVKKCSREPKGNGIIPHQECSVACWLFPLGRGPAGPWAVVRVCRSMRSRWPRAAAKHKALHCCISLKHSIHTSVSLRYTANTSLIWMHLLPGCHQWSLKTITRRLCFQK